MKKKIMVVLAMGLIILLIILFTGIRTLVHVEDNIGAAKIALAKRDGFATGHNIDFGDTVEEQLAGYAEWCDTAVTPDERAKVPYGFNVEYRDEIAKLCGEQIGDVGLLPDADWIEADINEVIEVDIRSGQTYADYMCDLALYYNRKLNYKENNVQWTGIFSQQESCGEARSDWFGIGNDEFVQIIYQHTFGYVPDELKDMSVIENRLESIDISSLRTGDIAMYETDDGRRDYAVCIGIQDGKYVFVHCVSTQNKEFFAGCAKMCYASSQTNEYFDGNEPTPFEKFYRSPIEYWGVAEQE